MRASRRPDLFADLVHAGPARLVGADVHVGQADIVRDPHTAQLEPAPGFVVQGDDRVGPVGLEPSPEGFRARAVEGKHRQAILVGEVLGGGVEGGRELAIDELVDHAFEHQAGPAVPEFEQVTGGAQRGVVLVV